MTLPSSRSLPAPSVLILDSSRPAFVFGDIYYFVAARMTTNRGRYEECVPATVNYNSRDMWNTTIVATAIAGTPARPHLAATERYSVAPRPAHTNCANLRDLQWRHPYS